MAGSGKATGAIAAGDTETDLEAGKLRGAMAGQVAERCQTNKRHSTVVLSWPEPARGPR